jgi:hypothetical protein
MLITVTQLHACCCGALSLTRGRVFHLPVSQLAAISLFSLCTIYILHVIKCTYVHVCIYNIYKPLSVQALYSRSCPIISLSCYNGSLVPWTVACLTAAKSKPLIFLVSGFALYNVANIYIFIILYDFCLFPQPTTLAQTAQKTSLPLLRVLSSLGKRRVHRAVS